MSRLPHQQQVNSQEKSALQGRNDRLQATLENNHQTDSLKQIFSSMLERFGRDKMQAEFNALTERRDERREFNALIERRDERQERRLLNMTQTHQRSTDQNQQQLLRVTGDLKCMVQRLETTRARAHETELQDKCALERALAEIKILKAEIDQLRAQLKDEQWQSRKLTTEFMRKCTMLQNSQEETATQKRLRQDDQAKWYKQLDRYFSGNHQQLRLAEN